MTKKKLLVAGATVLLLAGGSTAFLLGQDKSGDKTDAAKNPVVEQTTKTQETVEYGENLSTETFIVNTKEGKTEFKFSELKPSVDTMTIGKNEYKIVLDDKKEIDVEVTVEDTAKPVIEGVKEKITLTSNENIQEELAKLITAKDPVDGNVEVKFEIKAKGDNKNEYDVTANAEDKNGNTTSSSFQVIIDKKAAKSTSDSKDVAVAKAQPAEEKPAQPEAPKKAEAKPATKPAETKPATKPAETKPATKPAETKPATKPAETKPATKPSETKPATKPAETKPATKPAETKPATKPAETKPATKPAETKPATKPAETKPATKPANEVSLNGVPKITIVGSVPGASKVSQGHGEIVYSFNKSLPGGGKLTQALMLGNSRGSYSVVLKGTDKNGGIIYAAQQVGGALSYKYALPALSNEGFGAIQDYAQQFLNAHKK